MAKAGNDQSMEEPEGASGPSSNRRFPLRLALRFALSVSGLLLLLGIAMFVPSYQRYETALYERLEHVAWAEASAVMQASGLTADQNSLESEWNNLYPGELLKGLVVYDGNGAEIGSLGEPINMPFSPAGEIMRAKVEGHQRFEICWNPAISQTPYHFIARMDSAWIDQELSSFTLDTLARTFALSLFAAFLIFILMSKMVLQPIGAIRTAINSAAGDLSQASKYRISTKAKDEIGDISGDMNMLLGATTNAISELEEQRRIALDSEGKFGAIFKASHLPILLIDPMNEKIVEANRAAYRLFREKDSSLIARSISEFHPDEMPELRAFAASVMAGKEYKTDQLSCAACDGEVIPAELFASPVTLEGQSYMMVVVRDLTVDREYQNKLRSAKDRAELADRTKTEFLANMSHELRTPLNAILGFAEIIAGDLLGKNRRDEYVEFAGHIHTSGEHLLNIINDILNIAKIEIGELTLQESSVDPEALLEKCRVLISTRTDEAEQRLVIESAEALPRLWCDETKMKQIILNLLSNAVKFTPAGGTITASMTLDPTGCFQFVVADTGVGIPNDQLDQVFEPFGQVGSHQTRATEGTGLGLPIAKSLTELHGGILRLDSKVGVGTVVTVSLPKSRTEKTDCIKAG